MRRTNRFTSAFTNKEVYISQDFTHLATYQLELIEFLNFKNEKDLFKG